MKNTIESVIIENSSLCGANCVMCLRDNANYYYGIMPLDLYKKSINDILSCGINDFAFCAFGDPLMDNFLEERLRFIKESSPNAKIGLTTTGHLLNEKNADLLCKYVDFVKISNYGFSKKTYESVHRGSLKYEKVKQNIDIFLSIPNRPKTTLTFLVLPENEKDIDEWKKYYEPKCDEIDIWKPHNWGGNKNLLLKTDDQIPPSNLSPCRRAMELNNMIIRADGRVSICCFDISNSLIIGDIKMQNLNSIINGEMAKKIQKIHSEQLVLESDLPCKNCDQIRDRKDALIFTNNPSMKVGKYSLFKN